MPDRAREIAARLWPRRAARLAAILDLDDFERAARPRLPRAAYGYVAHGSETETSLRTNREAFDAWRLLPRVLVGVGERSQETELFGRRWAAPFGIAPMGGSGVVTYDGPVRMARAADEAGIPFVLSGNSIIPMEEVAAACPGAWFASYQSANREAIEGMVERVARAGFSVFVVTADVPVHSNREADRRNGFALPLRPNPKLTWDALTHPAWLVGTAARTLLKRGIPEIVNLEASGGPSLLASGISGITAHPTLDWGHVRLIRKLWKGPVVVKGILSAADARIAREEGIDAIVVSNHGGRQLDGAASPMQVLPEILAVAGEMPVIVDSGFRRGTDVLKALALGARFVLIGRPFLFAAAVGAEAGVLHAIALLAREIDMDMALLGLRRIADAGPEMLLDLGARAGARDGSAADAADGQAGRATAAGASRRRQPKAAPALGAALPEG